MIARIQNLLEWAWFWSTFKAAFLITTGYYLANLARNTTEKISAHHASPQQIMILKKFAFFGVLLLFTVSALQQLHFQLSALLGSAGIVTAAIAFASKTTISNLISGIFLIMEKSFSVGDTVTIKKITGVVESIDLLSVKLKTVEHTLVRIPNETIISSELINLTHYPHRRLDFEIGIAYTENIDKVKQTLLTMVDGIKIILKKPEPHVRILEFAESCVTIQLSVSVNKSHFNQLQAELPEKIKEAFDKHKIEIPYPQLAVHMVEQ